jgi:hypothetical protein
MQLAGALPDVKLVRQVERDRVVNVDGVERLDFDVEASPAALATLDTAPGA